MLGLQLGRLPSELAQIMTAAEEVSFMAYFEAEPFGDERADIRSAQIAQLLYNTNVGKKAQAKKLVDFLPFHKKYVKPDENISQSVRDRFAALIGKDS